MSVKDIAQAMGTSEGTVKSRLNYARKAIKYGVEDYERKGVKLYSASPILLLLCFLRREAEATALDGAAAAAMAGQVLSQAGGAAAAGGTAAGAAAGAAAAEGAGAAGAAAGGFFSALSVKAAAVILAAVVAVGGVTAGLVTHFGGQSNEASQSGEESGMEDENAAQPGTAAEPEAVEGEAPTSEGTVQPETFAEHAQVNVFDQRVTLVDTAGNLYMWGSWDEEQNLLGEGSEEPYRIMEDIRMVRTNRLSIAAIRTDGSLYFQKFNLPLGSTDPKNVVNIDNLVSLDVGAYYNGTFYAAIKPDGSLWMWGGTCGLAIDGVSDDRYIVEPVKVMEDVAQVSCGSYHTMALKTDGTLWAWGGNALGQLGNGSTEDASEPVLVMEDVAYIDCTSEYSAAVKTDGTLWMWGRNRAWTYDEYEGNESYNGSDTTLSPELIAEDAVKVSCGESYASFIKNDGSLWMWVGRGYEVSAMDGRTGLVQVMDNVVDASTDEYTVAIKADGSVWMCGGETPTQLAVTIPVENLGSVPWIAADQMGEQEPEPVDLAGAYAAYLSVLQSHGAQMSDYASWYETIGVVKPVNFVDVYGDAVPEMIFVEMTDSGDCPSRLVILTYEDGELVTLYENDVWDYFAGGGLNFVLYQAADSRTLYALTRNNLQGQYNVWENILFDESDGQFVAKVLKESGGYYWAGEEIDYDRYRQIRDEFPAKYANVVLSNWRVTTDTAVVLRYQTSAMTVAEAEAFLRENGVG